MAGPRFAKPFHGVREWAPSPAPGHAPERATTRELLARECTRYAVRLRPGQFYSHDTALVLAGCPAPEAWRRVIHVSAHRPAMGPRASGVVGHRLGERERAAWKVFGLPIEHPARAWVQTSRVWGEDDLIAAADFLVARRRPLVGIQELRDEARRMRGSVLESVLDQVRNGSESPTETKLRLLGMHAGLPEPELNLELHDAGGVFVARVDQAYPRYRVAVEYDGRQHAFDIAQFERDADRWDAIRALGWTHVRILAPHLRGDGAPAVAKIRAALTDAGWRPGL